MRQREKMTIIILPMGLRCNIACKYCYHGNVSRLQRSTEIMSDEVLKRIMEDAKCFNSDIDFLWHGGEPLLAGLHHFKNALVFQHSGSAFKGRIRNIIQSNLTLLTDEYCDFFVKNNFILSTSIDGAMNTHDANRVSANGDGTYARVLESISMWRKRDQRIGAVSLITTGNVKKPALTYLSLKKSGITSCNFHFCAQDESGSIGSIPEAVLTVEFLKKAFDLWLEDDKPDFPIRNFVNALRVLCGGRPLDCTSSTVGCFGFMAVTANGDVFACHRFVGRNTFFLGNILTSSLSEIYIKSEEIYEQMCSLDSECRNCKWLKMCGNGCAYERFVTQGSFMSKCAECALKKELFDYIENKTRHLIGALLYQYD